MIVSSTISIPPLKNTFLLSKSKNLFLIPITGWRTQPEPLPPVKETLVTDLISKSCGSTITSDTLPLKTGSTSAVVPGAAGVEFSTMTCGGFTTS